MYFTQLLTNAVDCFLLHCLAPHAEAAIIDPAIETEVLLGPLRASAASGLQYSSHRTFMPIMSLARRRLGRRSIEAALPP